MSHWLAYNLCVLGGDSKEVKEIAVRLNKPSKELRVWLCDRLQLPRIDSISDVLDFKILLNLANIEAAVRTFRLTIPDKFCGMVACHLGEISAAFPSATFLLETEGSTFSRKEVLRGGRLVRKIQSGNQANQINGGVTLDIFAPIRAEHSAKLAFGSLWERWLDGIAASLQQLRSNSDSASELQTPTDTALSARLPTAANTKRKLTNFRTQRRWRSKKSGRSSRQQQAPREQEAARSARHNQVQGQLNVVMIAWPRYAENGAGIESALKRQTKNLTEHSWQFKTF